MNYSICELSIPTTITLARNTVNVYSAYPPCYKPNKCIMSRYSATSTIKIHRYEHTRPRCLRLCTTKNTLCTYTASLQAQFNAAITSSSMRLQTFSPRCNVADRRLLRRPDVQRACSSPMSWVDSLPPSSWARLQTSSHRHSLLRPDVERAWSSPTPGVDGLKPHFWYQM